MCYTGLEDKNRWGVVFWKNTLQINLLALLQSSEQNKTQQDKQTKNLPMSVFKFSFPSAVRGDGKIFKHKRRKGALHTSTMFLQAQQ